MFKLILFHLSFRLPSSCLWQTSVLTGKCKAGAVRTSRIPRRMQLGVLQREGFLADNGEENSGTERAPLYSVPQGKCILCFGPLHPLLCFSWTGKGQSQVQFASSSLNHQVLRSSCKVHGMKHHQVLSILFFYHWNVIKKFSGCTSRPKHQSSILDCCGSTVKWKIQLYLLQLLG